MNQKDKINKWWKKRNKIYDLISTLDIDYLPVHSREGGFKPNGYTNTDEIIEKIMAECGISKPKEG